MHIDSQPRPRRLSQDWNRLTTADHLALIHTLRTTSVIFAVITLAALVTTMIALVLLSESLGSSATEPERPTSSASDAQTTHTVVFPSGSRYTCPASVHVVDCSVTAPRDLGHVPLTGPRSNGG